jgi:glutathione S-transferase
MTLVLWHCTDARSFRPLWALEELGLAYELKLLPFPPRALQKSYLGENPLGTIPLLVDGETRMTESVAIPHYLATKHGGGRLTLAPEHRDYGAYLNWLVHGEATLTFPQTIFLRYSQLEPDGRRQPVVADDYRRWFLARLRLAEAALADGRDFLVGGSFTMADISVAYALQLAISIGLEADLPPNALNWFRKLERRAGFQAAKAAQEAGELRREPAPAS